MNLIDAVVTEIISPVYSQYGKYWVKVEVMSWGRKSETVLMFNSEDEAREVYIGYSCLI